MDVTAKDQLEDEDQGEDDYENDCRVIREFAHTVELPEPSSTYTPIASRCLRPIDSASVAASVRIGLVGDAKASARIAEPSPSANDWDTSMRSLGASCIVRD
jgi:hypothetical protein